MNTNPTPKLTDNQRLFFYSQFVAQCPTAGVYIYAAFHKGYMTQAQLELFIKRINEPRRVLPIYGYVLAQVWANNFNRN